MIQQFTDAGETPTIRILKNGITSYIEITIEKSALIKSQQERDDNTNYEIVDSEKFLEAFAKNLAGQFWNEATSDTYLHELIDKITDHIYESADESIKSKQE